MTRDKGRTKGEGEGKEGKETLIFWNPPPNTNGCKLHLLAYISAWTNLFHSTFPNWWKLWTVTMNSSYKCTRKRAPHCVFIGPKKVCLELLSYLESVSHIINIPRLPGLYGKNIGPPGLYSGDRAASSHSVLSSIFKKGFIFSRFNTSSNSTLFPQNRIVWTRKAF